MQNPYSSGLLPAIRRKAVFENRSANLKESFCGIVCRRDFEHAPAEATRENNKEQEFDMKERLDVLLVSQGLATSREKAKAVIMAGNVLVNGQREDKAGTCLLYTSRCV